MNLNEIVKRYKQLYAGVVYDALSFDLKLIQPFVLDLNIKPSWEFNEVIVGPAFTCQGSQVLDNSHINDDIRIEMFQSFYDGCVQVISSGGFREVAQFGDISGKIAHKFGAIGAVCDAPVRDIRILKKDKFYIFSNGVQPIDAYGKWQIINYEIPIVMPGILGNVYINPGDLIYADLDGVLVIPKDKIEYALKYAENRMEKEDKIRENIYKTNNLIELRDRLGRW